MLHVFRLCRAEFAALDGEGAKLYGGRWNEKGHPVVYASSQLSLAVLELLVHTDADLIPSGLLCLEIAIPNTVSLEVVKLPKAYAKSKDDMLLKDMGTRWLQEKRTAVLSVPSIIVPSEQNILINPLHPHAKKIKIVNQTPFHLDPRLL